MFTTVPRCYHVYCHLNDWILSPGINYIFLGVPKVRPVIDRRWRWTTQRMLEHVESMIFKLLCRCQHSSHTSTDYFSTVYNKTEKSLVRCLRVVYFTVLIEVTLGNVLNSLFMPNTQNRRYFSRVYVTLSLNTSLPSFCRPPRIVVCAFRGRSASTRASVPRCVGVYTYVCERESARRTYTPTQLWDRRLDL